MLLEKIEDFETPEFTIIGSGPASICLAMALEKKNQKVLIIEAGGWNPTNENQDYYSGKVYGDKYFDLRDVRLRSFGGSAGHWGRAVSPLDEVDFNEWPIKKKDLDPYIKLTNKILEINNDNYTTKHNEISGFRSCRTIRNDIQFVKKYKKHILNSKRIFLLLNSPVLKIVEKNQSSSDAGYLVLVNKNKKIKIGIKKLILGCGGIENSRILLWSRHVSKSSFLKGLPIGNFWMEHPTGFVAQFVGEVKKIDKIIDPNNMYNTLSPTPKFIYDKGINNIRIRIVEEKKKDKGKRLKDFVKDFICIAPNYGKKIVESIQKKKMLYCHGLIKCSLEQKPYYDNKVTLSENHTDKLGIPKTNLHWKLTDDFYKTIIVSLEEIGKQFIEKNIGRIGISKFIYDGSVSKINHIFGNYHHMGGTRMNSNLNLGVVDKNLKVHNTSNFYIIGSSVFPSGGHHPPTFTIIQLSLRLAEHLTKKT